MGSKRRINVPALFVLFVCIWACDTTPQVDPPFEKNAQDTETENNVSDSGEWSAEMGLDSESSSMCIEATEKISQSEMAALVREHGFSVNPGLNPQVDIYVDEVHVEGLFERLPSFPPVTPPASCGF